MSQASQLGDSLRKLSVVKIMTYSHKTHSTERCENNESNKETGFLLIQVCLVSLNCRIVGKNSKL